MVPYLCRTVPPCRVSFVSQKQSQVQYLCIVKLVSKSNDLSCSLRTTYGKPWSTSLEKRAAAIQRDREYRTHTTTCEAKKELNEKSVQILGYKTEHLQANDLIGMASNFGDLIPHLGHVDALSLFEDWLSETSDL